jgi:predicted DNA-binding transcriptional regulator AlpA
METSIENESFWRVSQLVNKPGRRGLLGISRSALYRELSAGRFPKPCRPLPGIVAWPESVVRGWMQSHMSA